MSLLKIVKFQPRHGQDFDDPPTLEVLRQLARSGPCGTMMLGKKRLAALGLYKLHATAAEAWIMINPAYRHIHAKTIFRQTKHLLDTYQISEGFNRVQITIKFANADFVRWSQMFGFEMEGLLKRYGQDGQDHFLMSRIR